MHQSCASAGIFASLSGNNSLQEHLWQAGHYQVHTAATGATMCPLVSTRLRHDHYQKTDMTEFENSLLLCTNIQFNFIAQDDGYSQELSMHSVSTVQC